MEYISAIKDGCLTTFKIVYYQYHPKLYAYILKKTSSAYIAEEVVQLTFIKLWNNRASLAEEYALDIQIFRIARTTMIDELRKDVIRNTYLNRIEHTTANNPTDQFADRDTLKHVTNAIELLPPMRKMVFKLSRFNHLSNVEIAEMLSISTKTVENHISLAIKELRNSTLLSLSFLCVSQAILSNC
ncbi:sigma-70 family RNA polymerase sigma factor [Mucilaginibacter sp. Bleaf8]|uniref:sigma-70 family RNA polymerase sigma factor n=1 Tax=Mucilaginibacter sp. Bleaf8 TaxID=2834430 RepID=UPI001BCD8313|nr:sigma-70 family RNA polymerase sigma factor [Mucilaginibacter sp. Bleaf8]MBS7562933.1 sigma-70 family RNA polymerase sigma factor [Mucilaginibacter sp. Bleaf8]